MRITLQDRDTGGTRTIASGDESIDAVSGVQVSLAQSVDIASPGWPTDATPSVVGTGAAKLTASWTVTADRGSYLAGPGKINSWGQTSNGNWVTVLRGALVLSAPDGGGVLLPNATLTASAAKGIVAGTWSVSCSIVAAPVVNYLGTDSGETPSTPGAIGLPDLPGDVIVLADAGGSILTDTNGCAIKEAA